MCIMMKCDDFFKLKKDIESYFKGEFEKKNWLEQDRELIKRCKIENDISMTDLALLELLSVINNDDSEKDEGVKAVDTILNGDKKARFLRAFAFPDVCEDAEIVAVKKHFEAYGEKKKASSEMAKQLSDFINADCSRPTLRTHLRVRLQQMIDNGYFILEDGMVFDGGNSLFTTFDEKQYFSIIKRYLDCYTDKKSFLVETVFEAGSFQVAAII